MPSRAQLLSNARSGAKPLPGSPGPSSSQSASGSQSARSAPRRKGTSPAARPRSSSPSSPSSSTSTPAAAAPSSPSSTPAPSSSTSTPAPSSGRSSSFQPGQALGGLIVGLYVWGFVENWLRGGSAQAWAWVRSKFQNNVTKPTQTPGGTGYPTPTGNLPYPQQITQQAGSGTSAPSSPSSPSSTPGGTGYPTPLGTLPSAQQITQTA